jgi:hypothetical protein
VNKLSINDINILRVLEELGVRHKDPRSFWPIVDKARKNYKMTNDETFKTIKHLEEIGYIEGNGTILSLTEQMDRKMYPQGRNTMTGEYSAEQRKAARFKMLEKIYEETGGSDISFVDIYEIGEKLNFTTNLAETTAMYLKEEGLIEFKALGGCAGITHFGIKQYEQAVNKPEQESRFFPPVGIIQNILTADKIENVQIQQGNYQSKQEMNKNGEYDVVLLWLKSLEEAIKKENKNETLEVIKNDIEFIKNNIASGKPDKKYISMALDAIKSEIIKITASKLFQLLVQTIPILLP